MDRLLVESGIIPSNCKTVIATPLPCRREKRKKGCKKDRLQQCPSHGYDVKDDRIINEEGKYICKTIIATYRDPAGREAEFPGTASQSKNSPVQRSPGGKP